MEVWDIYDKNRNKTGKTMVRVSEIADDTYHMAVHICVFNCKGEMLIQQRQSSVKGWPNKWDVTAAGAAIMGDSSQIAAQRELFEEIGYNYDFKNVRPHLTINHRTAFDDYYLIEVEDIEIEKLKLQHEEVQQVKWATKEEILQLIEGGDFVPYYNELLSLLFAMVGRYGSRS